MERLNKFLALGGIASRRRADEMVLKGLVTVNDQPAFLGQKIDPAVDVVRVSGRTVSAQPFVYIAFHKPYGVISSTTDPQGRPVVTHFFDLPFRLYPVGRLDVDSTGLILLTNDGQLALKLTHPRYHLPKIYEVEVTGHVTDTKINQLKRGVVINGSKTIPCQIKKKQDTNRGAVLEFTLYQGLKRQIRYMAASVNWHVDRLKRIAIGPVEIANLAPGKWRYLTKTEVSALLNQSC